jgi:hypothetical protein
MTESSHLHGLSKSSRGPCLACAATAASQCNGWFRSDFTAEDRR